MPRTELTLPQGAKRAHQARVPLPLALTAAGWLVVGVCIAALSLLSSRGGPVIWPVVSFGCLVGGTGLIFRAGWARALISVIAAAGAFFVGMLSLGAFYPWHWFWWPGAMFVAFCAWTLFFAFKLWPDYQSPNEGAA